MAVSDIVVQVRSKRAPMGYSYIGEINNHSLCIKFSTIPASSGAHAASGAGPNVRIPPSISNSNMASMSNVTSPPPPVPPRPLSYVNLNAQTASSNNDSLNIEQTYVHVNKPNHAFDPTPPVLSKNQQVLQTQHSITYNPLQGVPFEINPVYSASKTTKAQNDTFVNTIFFIKIHWPRNDQKWPKMIRKEITLKTEKSNRHNE